MYGHPNIKPFPLLKLPQRWCNPLDPPFWGEVQGVDTRLIMD